MLSLVIGASAFAAPADLDHVELSKIAPNLASMVSRATLEPEALARELAASPVAQIANISLSASTPRGPAAATLPIVVAHGMGDSCFK